MTTRPQITIFTPTFNRAYILPKLYESLKGQSSKDFEWVIVDDGSTDNTESLVKKWQLKNNDFPIVYKKTKNGGKHRAINLGVKLAKTPLFFIIDSDDFALEETVSNLIKMSKYLKDNPELAAVSGTRITSSGKTIGGIGGLKKGSFMDASNLERERLDLLGDKQEAYRTSVLRKFPFPEIKEESFLSERIVWDKIAREGYKIRWFNIPLVVCEYRDDGLSKNLDKKNKENPKGFALYVNNFFLNKAPFREKLQQVYSYYYLLHDSLSDKEMVSNLKINGAWLKLAKVLYKIKHLSRTAK